MIILEQFETTSEKEIIRRIKDGETGLFEIFMRRNNPYLYKIGMSHGFTHQDVEDLMQESYTSAYLNLEKFKQECSFKTWVVKIMLNQCFHKKRRVGFIKEKTMDTNNEKLVPMFEKEQSDGYKKIIDRELNCAIENAIIQMPLDYRVVFVLRQLSGMSTSETAESLDISEANVKTRLNRARHMLKKELKVKYSPQHIFEFNVVYCDRVVNKVHTVID